MCFTPLPITKIGIGWEIKHLIPGHDNAKEFDIGSIKMANMLRNRAVYQYSILPKRPVLDVSNRTVCTYIFRYIVPVLDSLNMQKIYI